MSNKVILGLDTSNYTTSVCLMDLKSNIVFNTRKLLPVDKGKKGLRQSDALFHHTKHLPILTKEIKEKYEDFDIVAIAASTKPRPIKESYMPVFLASKSYGETMANLWNIPFYEFSHQEGHIAAGLWSQDLNLKSDFMCLHISGGTTEILKVTPIYGGGYEIEIIGGSSDISAGQLIDRVGTKLGLSFPAGPYLEKLSESVTSVNFNIPVSVVKNKVSFSGPETYFIRLLEEGAISDAQIAYATFDCIAKSLTLLIKNILKQHHFSDILIVGGVASNNQIRNHLLDKLSREDISIYFGKAEYCTDNAVGVSDLGLSKYLNENVII